MQKACFNEFPNQCSGCPEYQESRLDYTEQLLWLSGMGLGYPQQLRKVVKECKAFRKRAVEYQK